MSDPANKIDNLPLTCAETTFYPELNPGIEVWF